MSCTCNSGSCGVDHEFRLAACDITREINKYGAPILIRFLQEDTITRDDYGSIINRKANNPKKLELKSFPLVFSPTTKEKSNAGIREDSDLIAWTSSIVWINNNYDIDSLNTVKADVIVNGKTYEIVDKSLRDQFGTNFLYTVLGLNLK